MLNRVQLTFIKDGKEVNVVTHYLDMSYTKKQMAEKGWTYVRKQIINY